MKEPVGGMKWEGEYQFNTAILLLKDSLIDQTGKIDSLKEKVKYAKNDRQKIMFETALNNVQRWIAEFNKAIEVLQNYSPPLDVEELAEQKAKEKYPGEMNMMGYKINAQKNNQEKFIEGFKAGYASLPVTGESEGERKFTLKEALDILNEAKDTTRQIYLKCPHCQISPVMCKCCGETL